MVGGKVETDPEKLAQHCENLRNGAKKLYETAPNEGDMWFFELFHHLGDCATALRSFSPAQTAPSLSEQERHAVEHARHQVACSDDENPECCFDYELVGTLVRIIDRTCAVSSTVRDTCAGGIDPGWDECPKCGATDEGPCAFSQHDGASHD